MGCVQTLVHRKFVPPEGESGDQISVRCVHVHGDEVSCSMAEVNNGGVFSYGTSVVVPASVSVAGERYLPAGVPSRDGRSGNAGLMKSQRQICARRQIKKYMVEPRSPHWAGRVPDISRRSDLRTLPSLLLAGNHPRRHLEPGANPSALERAVETCRLQTRQKLQSSIGIKECTGGEEQP